LQIAVGNSTAKNTDSDDLHARERATVSKRVFRSNNAQAPL